MDPKTSVREGKLSSFQASTDLTRSSLVWWSTTQFTPNGAMLFWFKDTQDNIFQLWSLLGRVHWHEQWAPAWVWRDGSDLRSKTNMPSRQTHKSWDGGGSLTRLANTQFSMFGFNLSFLPLHSPYLHSSVFFLFSSFQFSVMIPSSSRSSSYSSILPLFGIFFVIVVLLGFFSPFLPAIIPASYFLFPYLFSFDFPIICLNVTPWVSLPY